MVKGKRENPVTRFLRETRSELRKVVWPSRQEATNLTIIVIAVTLTMAASLGFIDYIFSKLFGLLIR
ncbi:MAG: preprotein translocase subunit SecE [Anaerolineae bacterium]